MFVDLQEGQSREQKISEITAKLNELKRYHQTLLQKQKAQIVGYDEVVIKASLGYLVVVFFFWWGIVLPNYFTYSYDCVYIYDYCNNHC